MDEMRVVIEQELDATKANLTGMVEFTKGLRGDLEKSEDRVVEAEGRAEKLQVQLRELEDASKKRKEKELKELEGRLTSQFK